MEDFNLVTYFAAISAVAIPLFSALWLAIKKGSPYLKKWLDKVTTKFDELNKNFDCHTRDSDEEKRVLRNTQSDIMQRLKKGDEKFDTIVEQMKKESEEQSEILDFMNENRDRIVKLEGRKVIRERAMLEHDKEEFEKIKEDC